MTGAGGSIGSELCRQIAPSGPRRLVLLDHAEETCSGSSASSRRTPRHPSMIVPVLADCKEEERMREVLIEQRPAIVFHAAAYKHVG